MSNNLILRTLTSPYNDITRGSVLSHADIDNNFIFLKGNIIYTAETSGNSVILKKYNGDNLTLSISSSTSNDNYWTSGSTGNYSIKANNDSGLDAIGDYSIAEGYNSIASGNTSFIHSTNSIVTGDRSVVLGGQNITGNTSDTVYVPKLNINTLGTGTSVNNLGIDSNGFVVTATTSTKKYSTTLTSPSGGTHTITHNLNTTDISVSLWLVTTGDLTNARVTNRQNNSVDIIFSISPSEDIRVVIIG
jgi:hypothetical protein